MLMYKKDYCIIKTFYEVGIILMVCYNCRYTNYPTYFTVNNCSSAYRLICLYDYFNNLSVSHLLYLSKELYKAEIAIYMKQNYIQD